MRQMVRMGDQSASRPSSGSDSDTASSNQPLDSKTISLLADTVRTAVAKHGGNHLLVARLLEELDVAELFEKLGEVGDLLGLIWLRNFLQTDHQRSPKIVELVDQLIQDSVQAAEDEYLAGGAEEDDRALFDF